MNRDGWRYRIKAVQIDNLGGLLGIRRMDRVLNACIRELCIVKKGLDERIDEGLLRWFSYVERMKRDRIARRVCWCSFSGLTAEEMD